MSDYDLDAVQPEEFEGFGELGPEMVEEKKGRLRNRVSGILRRLASPFVWLWNRLAFAWCWLVKPNQVGKPITIRPRGLQVLVLLIVGNAAILGLLGYALYRVATMPPIKSLPEIVVVTPTPNSPPASTLVSTPFGSGGAIAFTLRRNSNSDIYAINHADRQLVRLTYDPAEDRDPAWSPDGQYIAFTSNRSNNWDIYLLDLASGALIRLTQSPGFDGNPSWSPDGEYIAFESERHGNLDIYIMSTSGGDQQLITTNRAPDYEPSWSPDSRAIAFTSFRDGSKDIYLHLVETRETIAVTNSPDVDEDYADWAPDGTQLAYVSGPRGNPSIQITTFDWDAMEAGQAQTELFGAGASPAWAPDGQSLIYIAHDREGRSHIIAAGMTGWAISQEVYNIDGRMDSLAWTDLPLSPRVIARAQDAIPADSPSLYIEMVQPPPDSGPPYQLVRLPDIIDSTVEEEAVEEEETADGQDGENEEEAEDGEETVVTVVAEESEAEETFQVSDRVNDSFDALRQRVIGEAGWDYLGSLASAWLPMTYTPPSGHSRMNWHVCGRAIGLDQRPYDADVPQVELVREDIGSATYWRVFIRAAKQDGSMGEPLREGVWDLHAREEGGSALVEGGAIKERVPSGYYVDFTTLADDYGWQRLPSLWRWRYSWLDIWWWEFQKTDGLGWWECMLELYEPEQIEASFGPIPGYEDRDGD
jgi:TolB protein